MSEYASFINGVREEADRAGLMVWDDVPAQVPFVDLPDGSTEKYLCQTAVKLGVDVIYVYLDDEEDCEVAIAGFAKHGIFHRILLAADRPAIDDEDYEDGVGWSPWSSGPQISYDDLDERMKALADALIAHPDYDPHDYRHETQVLADVLSELDDNDFGLLKEIAEYRFGEELETAIETRSKRIATKLIKDDGFDPLLEREGLEGWVQTRQPELEARVVRRAASELQSLAMSTGVWEAAREELAAQARSILEALPSQLRDRLGFTTRNTARAAILEPYLMEQPQQRRDQLVYWVCRTESDKFGMQREQRYATAAAILMDDHGEKKSSVGRILGLSSSVVERIHREYPVRIDIEGDEVLAALDPRLA